ncbi:MAG: GAF domain-containing protein [Pseudomonadota bacterium]
MSSAREAFFRQLQALTTRIHATNNIDEIMLDLSNEICTLFGSDRLTIYAVADDKAHLVSKVKTGLASFKQLRLPISAQSIAGYAALSRTMCNLRDVYDEAELKALAPELCFQQGVDKRTGYRTRQMLVAPIPGDDGVAGVVQLINSRAHEPFAALVEEGMHDLCATLGIAFAQRHKAPPAERTRFVTALPETVISRSQLDAALRNAAATGRDIEEVLLGDAGIKLNVLGRALADFYGVPYMAFHAERRRPAELLVNFNREFVTQNQWLPIEENKNGLYILCTDPDEVRHSGAVGRIFPQARVVYCVTTRRDFGWMLNQCFDAVPEPEPDLSAPVFQEPAHLLPPARRDELAATVAGLVAGAHHQGLSDLRIETSPGKHPGEVRFTVTGSIKIT